MTDIVERLCYFSRELENGFDLSSDQHTLLANAAAEITRLRAALEESVKLQSHYALFLNYHDGCNRLQFKSADEWLARLEALKAKP